MKFRVCAYDFLSEFECSTLTVCTYVLVIMVGWNNVYSFKGLFHIIIEHIHTYTHTNKLKHICHPFTVKAFMRNCSIWYEQVKYLRKLGASNKMSPFSPHLCLYTYIYVFLYTICKSDSLNINTNILSLSTL